MASSFGSEEQVREHDGALKDFEKNAGPRLYKSLEERHGDQASSST